MANTFWSQASLEPKRQFRFELKLGPFEKYAITKVNRPSFEIGESEHNYLNHKFYYPGRVTWQDISFTIIDPVKPDHTGLLMKMLMASGYRFPNSAEVMRTISKSEATSATGTATILVYGANNPGSKMDDPSAQLLETWNLKNPWMKTVTMGDLDYTSDEMLTMDITMRYDWATLSTTEKSPSSNITSPANKVPDKLTEGTG